MMRMVRCESDKEYENLWTEYNKTILNEPFLPAKYVVSTDATFGISPELFSVIEKKEEEIHNMEKGIKDEWRWTIKREE